MGTRNLTCVYHEGQYKIAQYGQYDGYPEGQGLTALGFLSSNSNIERLKSNLPKVRFIDYEGVDKKMIEEYESAAPKYYGYEDMRSREQRRWFESYFTRRLGAEILKNVAGSQDDEIVLKNEIDFAKDSLFCEWAYVIDLDSNAFEVYRGFNRSEPVGRFYSEDKNEDGYYPISLVKKYDLSNLPNEDEFLEGFSEEDED